jgi:hypothetical protein
VDARVFIPGCELTSPINLFIDLIELDDVTASGIFTSLLRYLDFIVISEECHGNYLVSVTCGGAPVIIGARGGAKKLLKDKFPTAIVWHCANHRLELSVHDAVETLTGINRSKHFIDKLYTLYHVSPKNARELQICAATLGVQLLKSGRILSAPWVTSSFRSVSALWQDYEALVFISKKQKTIKPEIKKIEATSKACSRGLRQWSLF